MPIWLNGALIDEADVGISPMDRGLLFGDGVFETIRSRGDRLLWIDDHLARLRAGARTLEIPVEMTDRAIVDGLETLLIPRFTDQNP